MPDYKQGKIYKLTSGKTNLIYIGSTTQTLKKRFIEHISNSKKNKGVTSGDIIKMGDCKIELIELFPCKFRNELHEREGEIQRENACVNLCIAGRTWKKWTKDNKEHIKVYKKEWYEENKERINKLKVICDICGSITNKCNLTRHKKSKKCLNQSKT